MIRCPHCRSDEHEYLASSFHYDWFRCKKCFNGYALTPSQVLEEEPEFRQLQLEFSYS